MKRLFILLFGILFLFCNANAETSKFVDTETIIQTLHLQQYNIEDIGIKLDYDNASFTLILDDKKVSASEIPYYHFVLLTKNGIITLDRYPYAKHRLSRVIWSFFMYDKPNPKSIMITGTFGKSIRTVTEEIKKLPYLKILYLHDITGTFDTNNLLALLKYVQQKKLITYVPKGSFVASGGTDLLIAGKKRFVGVGAEVDIHQFHWGSSATDDEKKWVINSWKNLYLKSGVDKSFLLWTQTKKKLYTMNHNELKKYKIINMDEKTIQPFIQDSFSAFLQSLKYHNKWLAE